MKQPFVVNIDVCGICNESCNYCPRSASYPNIKEYMSIDLFQKFIDDSQGYNGYICFTGRGENSLHPKFKQLVEIIVLMAYIHLYVIQKLTFQKNFILFQLNGMKQVFNGLSMVTNIGKDLMEIDQVSSVMVLKLQQMRRI